MEGRSATTLTEAAVTAEFSATLEPDGLQAIGTDDIAATDNTADRVVTDAVSVKQADLRLYAEAAFANLARFCINNACPLVAEVACISANLVGARIDRIAFEAPDLTTGLTPVVHKAGVHKVTATPELLGPNICRRRSSDQNCRRSQRNGSNSCFDHTIEHAATMRTAVATRPERGVILRSSVRYIN